MELKKSKSLPFHLFGIPTRNLKLDHFVSDTGDIVHYQTDLDLIGDLEKKKLIICVLEFRSSLINCLNKHQIFWRCCVLLSFLYFRLKS